MFSAVKLVIKLDKTFIFIFLRFWEWWKNITKVSGIRKHTIRFKIPWWLHVKEFSYLACSLDSVCISLTCTPAPRPSSPLLLPWHWESIHPSAPHLSTPHTLLAAMKGGQMMYTTNSITRQLRFSSWYCKRGTFPWGKTSLLCHPRCYAWFQF